MITKDKISLDGLDVMFEITRFCNMACPHCIRGDSQRIRIKKDYINATLSQLSLIGTMMFTGGEPALAIDLIDYTRETCQHYSVEVMNFWMATNGTIATNKFFDTIEKWVNYCSDNEISGLRVSLDKYHDEIYNRSEFEEFIEYRGLQLALELNGAPDDSSRLIGDGRALDNYYTTRNVEHNMHLQSDGRIEGSIYINAKGFVLSTCDISYDTADAKNSEFVICHCTDDIQEKLAEFFNKHPELVYEN
jgi:organic radical activating enzyme